jgi:hypothetical protein
MTKIGHSNYIYVVFARIKSYLEQAALLRPRPISIGPLDILESSEQAQNHLINLHTLLRLHAQPINLVVYKGSYSPKRWEI